MLQQDEPDDYVIATGKTYSVREFIELAANEFGYSIIWEGKGIKEKGIDKNSGKVLVGISPKYFRPSDVEYLQGDFSKARKKLDWEPKVSFHELVKIMVKADKSTAAKEKVIMDYNNVQ